MKYQSTKTYGHKLGLSCCFRQPLASSHCNLLHGYALSFKFVFGANELDDRNWVVDFGGLKGLKQDLQQMFDHTLAITIEDPHFGQLYDLHTSGLADVRFFPEVGCEAFAKVAFNLAVKHLQKLGIAERVRVISCECAEHGANSAIYHGE